MRPISQRLSPNTQVTIRITRELKNHLDNMDTINHFNYTPTIIYKYVQELMNVAGEVQMEYNLFTFKQLRYLK